MKASWIFTCFDDEQYGRVQRRYEAHRVESRTSDNGDLNSTLISRQTSEKDWLKEYMPKNPSELVVQKPKLDQLNEWLRDCSRNIHEAPILLITGPPGAGKSTALKVLAAAQNIQVIEWETPMDIDTSELEDDRYITKSQSMKFETFLMASGRYLSVLAHRKDTLKLILVKELPHVFSMYPSKFEELMRKYRVDGRTPIVFSFPEQVGSGSFFSKELLGDLNVHQISFNKVPSKSVMKALKRICDSNEVRKIPSTDMLEKIVGSVNGDLRSAILQLYYEFVRGTNVNLQQDNRGMFLKNKKSTSKKGTSKKSKVASVSESGVRDRQLPIFQRVGRLLYPKKTEEDAASLSHDPEEIVQQTLSHPRRFFDMVIENYLKVFRDMREIRYAISYASDVDSMISEFRERELTLPMALSTLARGFMTCRSIADRKWTPLTNKEYSLFREKINLRRERITQRDPKYILMPRDVAMDIFPIMEKGGGFPDAETKNKKTSEIKTKELDAESLEEVAEKAYEIQDSDDEDELFGEWIDMSSF